MKEAVLIYPHQLFDPHPAILRGRAIYLVEDPLFFGDNHYPMKFHKMKLLFHRATMKVFQARLMGEGHSVTYLDYPSLSQQQDLLFTQLLEKGYDRIHFVDPDDFMLKKRLLSGLSNSALKHQVHENPAFLNRSESIQDYFHNRNNYLQHSFYIAQRKKFGILVQDGKPLHGKWSFDADNRKPLPASFDPPGLPSVMEQGKVVVDAKKYIQKHFPANPGKMDPFYLPVSARGSRMWFDAFLEERFEFFGRYQDAIDQKDSFLMHSVISPMMNTGLITPAYIIQRTLEYIRERKVPVSSTEGFIRQILGWREFIRGIYAVAGVQQRTSNFWGHKNNMPEAFYTATTGIEPIDATIRKLLDTGYNHHIERLMVLGNFMLLCEIHPTDVYKWFMEMYVDAYDWVMVPNVYGMSQFADGGLMSTKPYLSSSNYIRKMSNFKQGEWAKVWDALFWSFISKHEQYFATNRRTIFLHKNLLRMPADKLKSHLEVAQSYTTRLFQGDNLMV